MQNQILSNLRNGATPIILIDNQLKLIAMCNKLSTHKEIAFDTEFDRFRWEYGFKLMLLQIYDGKSCFLIDPKLIKCFKPVWSIFENPEICKVVYSGREDVDLLKRNNCNPQNLFDIQKAFALCNKDGKSFSELLKKELGLSLDKTEQTSNWSWRPLRLSQLIYASNDVIYLLKLKEIVMMSGFTEEIKEIIQEENEILEASTTSDFIPKLSPKQIARYSKHKQEKLLALKIICDEFAEKLNIPPCDVVNDKFLEEIIDEPFKFITEPFKKGFSKRALNLEIFRSKFTEVIQTIKVVENIAAKESRIIKDYISIEEREKLKALRDIRLDTFKEFIKRSFGELASTVIMEGLSKRFNKEEINWVGAKKYQIKFYRNFINQKT